MRRSELAFGSDLLVHSAPSLNNLNSSDLAFWRSVVPSVLRTVWISKFHPRLRLQAAHDCLRYMRGFVQITLDYM